MDLSGKVIFITGAAQGLGKAYAEAVLEQGAKVFFGDLNSTLGAATLKEFQERFTEKNVRFTTFDVTNHQQFTDAFNLAVSIFGNVDVLVNNAGILSESNWELMVSVNLSAVVFGTKLATEHMRKDKGGRGGRIINISSTAGLGDYYIFPVYCGIKHAVRSFTSAISQQPNVEELGVEYGILCPDAVTTGFIQNLDDGKVVDSEEAAKIFIQHSVPKSQVVDGFIELLQLQKLNGAILQVTLNDKSYRTMENKAV
uniref:15-hydroxyprostaglandin dehydrogenase [NAD(+)] n=1 Tax=Arion vulgaris TaxID=1028688 RepID=A0A0B7B7W6_9EUPU